MLPPSHPQRLELNDEAHARPPVPIRAPLRATYLALFIEGGQREAGWAWVQQLAAHYGVAPPSAASNHFASDLGDFRIKCERHTEFLRLVFLIDSKSDDPFGEAAIGKVPEDWLSRLPGQIIVATHVTVFHAAEPVPEFAAISAQCFDGNPLIGASIAAGGAFAMSDFRVRDDGFSRFLILDRSMTPLQAGRMVQRLLEIDTYRILALMALPVARALAPALTRGEQQLAEITEALVMKKEVDEPLLFERLTRLEAEIESEQSRNSYRFDAAFAYEALVRRRILELREERLSGLQTFQEFTERRLAPAIETCRSMAARQEKLSQRLAQVTQLLTTRVEITREGQSQRVLESMDRRAKLQLRLQETVEGLSVAAIAYYIVGLVTYAAKGAKAAGLRIEVDVVAALSIPVVVLLTGLAMRRVRRAVMREA